MLPSLLAHGTAGLAGEGVPVAVVYAIVVVGAALLALALRARGAAPVGGPAVAPLSLDGAECGPWPGDGLGAPARLALQALGVAALAFALATGWFGSELSGANPAPLLLLAVGWWAVPALSWLLGDWWRLVDPYDALAAVVDRVRGRPAPGPEGLVGADADEPGDWWVPALLLASFAWLVTCWPDGLRPRAMAAWLAALTVLMLAGAVLGGRAWVRRTSPLAVVAGTVAAASPLSWAGGRPRLRSPFRGLAARAGGRRSLAALVVVLGATVWEATAGSQWWADLAGLGDDAGAVLWSTVGLAWAVLLVGAAWVGIVRLAEVVADRRGGPERVEPLAPDLAAALGPLAVVAAVAHQLGSLLVDVQDLVVLALDPFAEGWDLFDSYSWRANEQLLSPATLGWVQVGLLAAALGVGLVGAWDRAIARLGPAVAEAGWVLAGWTAAAGAVGVWLLLGA
ncbi:MAG TPA: hypothetical protein VEW93_05810 [Acidimicrobiales bacterium]|nr:hypothetical protein [Acidimicrobiales bacterium]